MGALWTRPVRASAAGGARECTRGSRDTCVSALRWALVSVCLGMHVRLRSLGPAWAPGAVRGADNPPPPDVQDWRL